MKANEAPEKIYVEIHHPFGNGFTEMLGFEHRGNSDDIEYIQTDAFIEKARKWFEMQNEWRDINGIKHCDMESFEEFRNYMKGE